MPPARLQPPAPLMSSRVPTVPVSPWSRGVTGGGSVTTPVMRETAVSGWLPQYIFCILVLGVY